MTQNKLLSMLQKNSIISFYYSILYLSRGNYYIKEVYKSNFLNVMYAHHIYNQYHLTFYNLNNYALTIEYV